MKLPALILRPPITLLARPPLITDPLLGPPPLRFVTLPLSRGGMSPASTVSRDLDFFFFFLSSLPSLLTSSSGIGGGGGDCIIICLGLFLVERPEAEESQPRRKAPSTLFPTQRKSRWLGVKASGADGIHERGQRGAGGGNKP